MKCWYGLQIRKARAQGNRCHSRYGRDGFLLAAQGYEVTLYEQNPVIAVLLKDALRRAKKHPY